MPRRSEKKPRTVWIWECTRRCALKEKWRLSIGTAVTDKPSYERGCCRGKGRWVKFTESQSPKRRSKK